MKSNFFYNKKLLVVAAHPDDEMLGVGGTIHNAVLSKKAVAHSLILSKGIFSRISSENQNDVVKQKKNIVKATSIIGFKNVSTLDFPDNRFDSVDLLDLVKSVENIIKKLNPDIIFTHHSMDLNIDHRKTYQAVITATRPVPGIKPISILSFETPSSTEWQTNESDKAFLPNFFIEIKKQDLVAKQKALKVYSTECKDYPHPRSQKGLEIIAQRWGLNIGVKYAEAFRLVRHIEKI
jgi:LmbE family N-acetylglucosaminyl deacetylase